MNNPQMYRLIHTPSNSLTLIEIAKENNKAKVNGVFFAKGNIVSLVAVRECLKRFQKKGS